MTSSTTEIVGGTENAAERRDGASTKKNPFLTAVKETFGLGWSLLREEHRERNGHILTEIDLRKDAIEKAEAVTPATIGKNV